MSTIHLEAVSGRVLPVAGRRAEFYGLRRDDGADESAVAHRVPDGHAYVSAGPFPVEALGDLPRDSYLRRAVLRGDLRVVTPTAALAAQE